MRTENINLLIGAGQLLLALLWFLNVDKAYLAKRIPNIRVRSATIYILLIGGFMFSGYGFYLANKRPKEKIVEKSVDRIIEKTVPAQCPAAQTPIRKPRTQSPAPASVSSSGQNSPPIGTVNQGAGSAFSNNQQGGVTAGTFIGHVDPTPRKLTDAQVADLTFAAAQHPSKIFILYTSNDEEAYEFAKQIYNALHAAGWTFHQDVTPAMMMSEDGKPTYGIVVTYKGDKLPPGTPVKLDKNQPWGAVASELFRAFPGDFYMQASPNDPGYFVLSVYTNPKARLKPQ